MHQFNSSYWQLFGEREKKSITSKCHDVVGLLLDYICSNGYTNVSFYFKNSEVPFRLRLLCQFHLMKWKLSQGWMFEHQCVVKSKLDDLKGLWWAVDQSNIRNQCLLHHTVNAPWNILYSNIKCTQYEIRPFNHNSWSMSLSFVQFYYVTYISNCVRFPHRQMQIANLVNL